MGARTFLTADQELFSFNELSTSRYLFSKWVKMIEIEAFSYCNRQCWFCPNSKIDRKTFNDFLDFNVFEGILKGLASISYNKMVSFSRYNEPFSHERIFDYISLTRKYLPDARIHTNSNSDYVNLDILDRAIDAGLNSVVLQIYLPQKYDHDRSKVEKFRAKILARLKGIEFTLTKDEPAWLEWNADYKGLRVGMRWRDFSENGVSRADLSVNGKGKRISPCMLPITSVYIDYNSKVMPCCNLRSDYEPHQSSILGDLKLPDTNIFTVFGSHNAVRWRRSLFNFNEKEGVCSNCHFSSISYEELGKELYRVRRLSLQSK
jgi:hypothetical protein